MPAPTLMVRSRGSYSRTCVQPGGGNRDIGRRDGAAHPTLGGISKQRDLLVSRIRLGQALRQFLGAGRNNGHELAIVSVVRSSGAIASRELALQNPIGFGASDFLELALAALLLVLALVSRPWIEPFARKLAPKTGWCMLLLALLPVALRLALLPHHPVPSPDVYDEFGHLLVADTLLHFRLANPPHPLHQFFETFFVLQTPTYASIYPIGQGLTLAIGRAIFGLPWAGVLLSTAAMCALCYWMLRGWTTPEWALLGGTAGGDRIRTAERVDE